MKNYKQIVKLFLFSLIGGFILFFLLKNIKIDDIKEIVNRLNIFYLVIGFLLYIIVYLMRAKRFYFLLKNKISFKKIFVITCIHNFFNMILPARTGEISYSIMLKKDSIRMTDSLSHVVIARIYDLFGLFFLFFISLFFFLSSDLKIFSLLGLLLIIVIFFIFNTFLKKIVNFLNKIKSKNNFIFKVKLFLSNLLNNINILNKNEKIWLIINSLLINFLMFLFGYVIMIGMSFNISIWACFVGGFLAFLTTILPIQGFFNIGTMELGWVFGYVAAGLSLTDATTSGVMYHLINIIFTLSLSLFGFLLYFLKIKNEKL
jgi:uncharacterized protein (TIRG00374 family)